MIESNEIDRLLIRVDTRMSIQCNYEIFNVRYVKMIADRFVTKYLSSGILFHQISLVIQLVNNWIEGSTFI